MKSTLSTGIAALALFGVSLACGSTGYWDGLTLESVERPFARFDLGFET